LNPMRSPILVGVVLGATLGSSCTRQMQVGRAVARAAPPRPAPVSQRQPTVWERQVKNAVDAGDGDYQLRVLRDKVAAEPENISARLDLAKAYQERGFPDVALE